MRTTFHGRLAGLAILCALLGAGAPGRAQERNAAGYPKVFEVVPDKLNLRAGIGQNYKVLLTVQKGDQLVGEEEQVGWVRIRAPKGIHCFVSRDFVDAAGAGGGTVNADHVNLRPTPSTTHPPLLQLNKGDKISVVREVEGWFEIEAPAAVPCWATKEMLREVGPSTGREATIDVTGGGTLPDNSGGAKTVGKTEGPRTPESGGTGTESPPPTKTPEEEHPKHVAETGNGGTESGGTPPAGTGETTHVPETGGTGAVETPAGANETHTPEAGGATPAGTGTESTPAAGTATAPPAGTTEIPAASPGRSSLDEGLRLMRIEDEKEARDQDYEPAIRQFEIAMGAGLSSEERVGAEAELRRMESAQKILEELRVQNREIRAISDAEKRRRMEEARKHQPAPFLAEGYVDSVGKLINRPAMHKLVKAKRMLYFLSSMKYNLNDYVGKRVGIRGKVLDAPGWEWKVVIVDELEVLGN